MRSYWETSRLYVDDWSGTRQPSLDGSPPTSKFIRISVSLFHPLPIPLSRPLSLSVRHMRSLDSDPRVTRRTRIDVHCLPGPFSVPARQTGCQQHHGVTRSADDRICRVKECLPPASLLFGGQIVPFPLTFHLFSHSSTRFTYFLLFSNQGRHALLIFPLELGSTCLLHLM